MSGRRRSRDPRPRTAQPGPFFVPPPRRDQSPKPRPILPPVLAESASTSGSAASVMSSVSSKSDMMHSVGDVELCSSGRIWAVAGDVVGAVQDMHELHLADVPPRPVPKKLFGFGRKLA